MFSNIRPSTPGAATSLLWRTVATVGSLPLLALTEDGGTASLLRHLLPALPSPVAASRAGALAVARLGDLIGAAMNLLGFNTNFAPALDLLTPFSEAILGPRALIGDPQQVAQCAQAFVGSLTNHRVLACGKHFPGLGGAQTQAGSSRPVVAKTMAELWREDLVPYRKLGSKLPLVVLSDCAYKAYDFEVPRPAALSPGVVEGLLRVKLGYAGLAVADLRPTRASATSIDAGDAAAQSMIAGCDLLVTTFEGAGAALDGLRKAIELGTLSISRLDHSVERQRAARRRLARPRGKMRKIALDGLAKRFERFSKECQAEEQKIA